ncbi:hypothetical protein RUM43_013364 [Polyplax serrata]|uniref:Protein cueball n=1 Tax=Polyplax serrata TaxID=468196 RepID=A0AAN8S709_POLSC
MYRNICHTSSCLKEEEPISCELEISDLAVANDEGINFFDIDGRITSISNEFSDRIHDFYVLTYDFVNGRIIFSVNEHEFSIFAYNLSDKSLTPLVPRQKNNVEGMAYYPESETLFWTDGNGHSIWRRVLSNESTPVELFFNFTSDIPAGITISRCKGFLFWTNSNHRSASIDRSDVDGSNHVKLITENLFMPLAVTVDDASHKLYWTEDQSGIYYKIERSNLDGKQRELIVRQTNQEPFGLATLNSVLYWTDTVRRNIWTIVPDSLYLNGSETKSEPKVFHDFDKSIPYGIVAIWFPDFECTEVPQLPTPPRMHVNQTAVEDPNGSYCLNSGQRVLGDCRCKVGFTGNRCEISECHNFCLNGGECYLDGAGFAECRCPAGYVGSRCDRDLCSGFCLNGGRCLINNTVPVCACGTRYAGQRCEISVDFVCNEICVEPVRKAKCNCSNGDGPKCEATVHYIESVDASQCQEQRIITIFLICFEALTVLVVVMLARKVCVLRRRPRIKKRIIINKGVKSQTPMTARPQSVPSEQCEITIENCCNMNICETPCFEPSLRSSRPSSSQPKRTEDKLNLLKNMEEELDGSKGLYS